MALSLIPPAPRSKAAAALTGAIATVLLSLGGCSGMSDPTGLLGGAKREAGGAQREAGGAQREAGGAQREAGGNASGPAAPAASDGAQPTLAERPADSGPSAPTAVIEETFTLDGVVMPVTRGQSRVETRADRRRTDSAVTFDNWLMRRLAPDGRTSDIVRVDRQLVWNLVPTRREYTECPLGGCRSGKQGETTQPPADQPQQREPDCPVKLTANDLKVQPTGDRRAVNGFQTERYRVGWMIQLTDDAGQSVRNQVDLDLWTTPETGAVKEVQTLNDAFNRRYAAALAGSDSPVARFLPKNVSSAMSSLMRNIDRNDKQTLARWEAELKKLRGYPIETTMTWAADGRICEAGRGAAQPSAASLGGQLAGMLGGRKSDGGPTPLITFHHEVRSLAVKPVADSVFSPPADYRRSN